MQGADHQVPRTGGLQPPLQILFKQ
jgi:hypothetical protein